MIILGVDVEFFSRVC